MEEEETHDRGRRCKLRSIEIPGCRKIPESRRMSLAFKSIHAVIQPRKSDQNEFWKSSRISGTILAQERIESELEECPKRTASRRALFCRQLPANNAQHYLQQKFKIKSGFSKLNLQKIRRNSNSKVADQA